MHEMGAVDALAHISEIRSGIILRISVRKPADIAIGSGSISNLLSKYMCMSCVFGTIGTLRLVMKDPVISAST